MEKMLASMFLRTMNDAVEEKAEEIHRLFPHIHDDLLDDIAWNEFSEDFHEIYYALERLAYGVH